MDDEYVAVSGSLTDGEILSAADTNEKSNDEGEDDTSEPLAEVSVKEARESTVLQYFIYVPIHSTRSPKEHLQLCTRI